MSTVARPAIIRTFRDARDACEKRRCIPMAIEALGHGKIAHLHVRVHILDISVAGFAADLRVHVGAMVEVHIIRNPVDALPRQSDSGFVVCRESLDLGLIFPRNRVTIHARRDGGDKCVRRRRCSDVAILAINLHRTCVQLVRKRNGLNRRVADFVALGAGYEIRYRCGDDGNEHDNRHAYTKYVIKPGFFHAPTPPCPGCGSMKWTLLSGFQLMFCFDTCCHSGVGFRFKEVAENHRLKRDSATRADPVPLPGV
jgi:hypothetical protein